MKNYIISGAIALIVSIVMLSGYHFFFRPQPLSALSAEKTPISLASYHGASQEMLPNSDFVAAASQAMPAVVHIKSKMTVQSYDPWLDFFGWGGGSRGRSAESSGSGVVMNTDGYIVTNNHVIKDADEITVTLYDNRTFVGEVIGADPSSDLGVIKIKADHLSPIGFANSDEVKVGEWVLAVGNPFNLSSTVTAGIVSAIGRNLEIIKDQSAIESFIQTDAAVNPGNSGGALVDMEGRLVGVNTAISSPTGAYAGYAFAIPANIVEKIVDDIIRYGTVQRAYLGLGKITVLNNTEAEKNDISVQEGILVHTLNPNGSAAKAGLQAGDIILKIDGTPVKSEAKLTELTARHRPGDNIKLTIHRNNGEKNIEVLLRNQQGTTSIVRRSPKLQALGIDLVPLEESIRKQYKIEHGMKISRIYAGKFRQVANVQPGFVILEMNGKKVATEGEVTDILENTKGKIQIDGFMPNYYINGRLYTDSFEIEL
jgi:Do/DeqQ family serine protease